MFVAAIILSLATLASAWTGYEASLWGSQVTKANRAATTARIRAVAASDLANRNLTTDILLFLDWFQAEAKGETALADEMREHFRSEFVPIFEEWLATSEDDQLPPTTPFDLDYVLAADLESARLSEEAAAAAAEADRADEISGNYVRAAVLYASVLFLAGISSKIPGNKARRLTIVLSAAAFVAAVVFTLSQPVILA